MKAQVDYVGDNLDDMILRYSFEGNEECPTVTILVDTQPTARTGEEVTERLVNIQCFYVLPDSLKTPENRVKVLELNNRLMTETWPSQVYIDKDGDIAFQCTINIPHKAVPVHMMMVGDRLQRLIASFCKFHEMVKEAFPSEVR